MFTGDCDGTSISGRAKQGAEVRLQAIFEVFEDEYKCGESGRAEDRDSREKRMARIGAFVEVVGESTWLAE